MVIKTQSIKRLGVALATVSAFAFAGAASAAGIFDAGIPSGWTGSGNYGTSGPDGVVNLPPSGNSYGWVSTAGGESGINLVGVGGSGSPTNGSQVRSSVFTAAAGDELKFNFNYVTSDGSGYADYAWARLLDSALNQVALLFTARTNQSGNIFPGFEMPVPEATLTPSSVGIQPGTTWSPLGGNSGQCYMGPGAGCGNTGWITSAYNIAAAGNYILEFGVTNWNDENYNSGLAFEGITVGGTPIGQVPEPASLALLGLGLVGLSAARRKKAA